MRNSIFTKITIISGGQSGVDMAALDFAIENNIRCGGWCPKGRINENGVIHKKYPLKETKSAEYPQRTEKNIKDSDGTIVLFSGSIDDGTKLTIKLLLEMNKPFLTVDISESIEPNLIEQWINTFEIKRLNIAGPRESNSRGIYNLTIKFLQKLM